MKKKNTIETNYVYNFPKEWDSQNSKFIDKDIIEEIKGLPMFYSDIIMLQIIKELKRLIKKIA